jgi:hypothetical protein
MALVDVNHCCGVYIVALNAQSSHACIQLDGDKAQLTANGLRAWHKLAGPERETVDRKWSQSAAQEV